MIWKDLLADNNTDKILMKGNISHDKITFKSNISLYLGVYILAYSRWFVDIAVDNFLGDSRFNPNRKPHEIIVYGDTDSLYFPQILINDNNKWMIKNSLGYLTDELGQDYGDWDSPNDPKTKIIKMYCIQ